MCATRGPTKGDAALVSPLEATRVTARAPELDEPDFHSARTFDDDQRERFPILAHQKAGSEEPALTTAREVSPCRLA